MPPPRTWLPRSKEIIEVIRRMICEHLDRREVEEIFQLQRRAAILLMTQAGAPKAERGAAALVSRVSLLHWVEKTAQDEAWQLERRRARNEALSRSVSEVQAVREALTVDGRPPVSFPLVEEVFQSTCDTLPHNIVIQSGTITVRVDGSGGALQACQLLYELGRAIANDFDCFEKRLAEAPPTDRET